MCDFQKDNGEPCRMPSLTGGPLCWVHDPATAPARAVARREGGRRNRTRYGVVLPDAPLPLRSITQVQAECERLYHDTLQQPNGALRSRSLAAVLALALKVLETGELEQRIEALEARQLRRA
jgi:hypothetical protein